MDQKLNIQLPAGTTELRLGEALPQKHPEQIIIAGNFQAVGAFVSHRIAVDSDALQKIDPKTAIIICDKDNLSIEFNGEPNDPFCTIVKGKAEYTQELKQFGINTNVTFKREELIKLIKFNRQLFPNKELHAELLKAYQQFQLKSTKNIEVESNNRGDRKVNYNKKVDSDNIPTHFALQVPIFKGEPSESFPVEICIEDTDGGTLFWFESPELAELVEERKQEMFDRELNLCQGLCVIWK